MESFIGSVLVVGFNFSPRQYAFCAGQLYPIAANTALFALIGTAYGGDGRSTLGLPDLRSRAPTGSSVMGSPVGGLNAIGLGEPVGHQEAFLSLLQMPQHNHTTVFNPFGSDLPAEVYATAEDGTHSQPADGDFLAQPSDLPGADKREHIFKATPSTTSLVPLGGVFGGSAGTLNGLITVQNAGLGNSVDIVNPCLGMAYVIAFDGVFPSRN